MFIWNNLKAHLGSQDLSFDALSKQLFRRELQKLGKYRPVGGVGQSQGGVEAIIEKSNGDEVGIQAKWFPNGTISSRDNGRRQQIINSLKLASKRTRLKKWVLSVPMNFDDKNELTWWNNLKKKYHGIELQLWDKDFLEDLLTKPENYGIKTWFFNDLEFDKNWFKSRTEAIAESLSQKYKPSLHVEGEADEKIQYALGNEILSQSIIKNSEFLEEYVVDEIVKLKNHLKEAIVDQTAIDILDGITQSLDIFIKTCKTFNSEVVSFSDLLKEGNISEANNFSFTKDLLGERVKKDNDYEPYVLFDRIQQITYSETRLETEIDNVKLSFKPTISLKDGKKYEIDQTDKSINVELKLEFLDVLASNLANDLKKINKDLKKNSDLDKVLLSFFKTKLIKFSYDIGKLRGKLSVILDLIDEAVNLHSLIFDDISYFKNREIIFLANRGIGKTHLVLKACEKQAGSNKPATIIIGSQITNQDTLKKQISEHWGILASFTWYQIIQAMESYAEANNCRILFVFDALNESPYWDSIIERDLNDTLKPLLESGWFVVVLTARTTYAEPLFGSNRPNRAYYLSNDMDIEEYSKKYFDHYKLHLKNSSPSLRKHLNDRFFVTLISKTYGNPLDDKVKEMSLDNFDISTLFEDYIKKSDMSICKKLKAPGRCQLVRRKLISLCKFLFEKNVMQLSKFRALEIIEEENPAKVRTDSSWLVEMVDEGLLVDLTWQNGIEVLEFSHQRLGEYLIACAIVEDKTPKEIYEQIRLHTNNPRITDILEMVGVLTPKFINKHLYEFLPSQKFIDSSQAQALFEISPKYISNKEIDWLKSYFNRQNSRDKQPLISTLFSCAPFEEYPFNAVFTSNLLFGLGLTERDLIWTEWLREERTNGIDNYPLEFEEKVKGNLFTSSKSLLLAELLKWFLVTTNRDLRDKTTKALYWFGRNDPSNLFSLTIEALRINDPYVPERLLAASYGVAMALHEEKDSDIFIDQVLSEYVNKLYENMFASKAKHGTTHILSRDYARRTIELYLLHRPHGIKKDRLKNIKPPFKHGGIRKWGESDDRDKGAYRDGNSLLGFDWGNYTLGHLVPDRSPYQDTEEFKLVKRQLLWRVYEFGYSLREFGEIDKQIARLDRSFGGDSSGKIDRYGKKYCWISYFELAGYRADKGLLNKDRDWVTRTSEVDIDPSFPEPASKIKVLQRSLIEYKFSPEQWVKINKPFDIKDFVVVKKLADKTGPWILLEGFMSEKNKKIHQGAMVSISGLLVDNKDADDLVSFFLEKKDPYGRSDRDVPSLAGDYYTFSGEIPWSETFPPSSKEAMDFLVDETKKITKKYKVNFSIMSYLKDTTEDEKGKEKPTEIENEVIDYEAMEKQGLIRKIEVIVPVRGYSWESYHSSVNQAGGAKVVNKEISTYLRLHIAPQSFNLIDQSGNQASFSIENGSVWRNGESYVYLRQDLLDKYLAAKSKSLVWLIWGEREYEPDNYESRALVEFSKKHGNNYLRYYDAIKYRSK